MIREYMARKLFSKADEESIDIVERAIDDLRKLGATIVDPGPEGALFQGCIARYAPELLNSAFTRQYRDLFPVDAAGRPNPIRLPRFSICMPIRRECRRALSLRSLNARLLRAKTNT